MLPAFPPCWIRMLSASQFPCVFFAVWFFVPCAGRAGSRGHSWSAQGLRAGDSNPLSTPGSSAGASSRARGCRSRDGTHWGRAWGQQGHVLCLQWHLRCCQQQEQVSEPVPQVPKITGDALLCSATNPPKTPTRALAQPKPAWMSSNPAADSELRVDKCQKGPLSSRLPGPAVTSSVLASAPMTRGGAAEQFWLGFFFGEDSSSSVLKDLKGGESATSLGKVIALPIKNL